VFGIEICSQFIIECHGSAHIGRIDRVKP
jgi:hypothetical protein